MPVADHYAIPESLYAEGVRRYGFHGLSYEFVADRLRRDRPRYRRRPHHCRASRQRRFHVRPVGWPERRKHLGFTALDGLPMGTRPGQIDPGIVLHLLAEKGMTAKVLLATVATVIASQALISGAFSLASQAIRLGLFPRLTLLHTHERHAGQIYVPFVNWSLFAGCVLLVATFGSSAALAAAYGLSVSGVMVITSIAMFRVALVYWNWRPLETGVIWGALLAVNIAFLVACLLKFVDGGYVPLSIGVVLFLVMATWRWGRKATFAAYSAKSTMTMAELVELHRGCSAFMERNAVMAAAPLRQPKRSHTGYYEENAAGEARHPAAQSHLRRSQRIARCPYIRDNRYRVTVFDRDHHRGGIVAVEVSFGFMEEPNVERLLEEMARHKQIDLPTDRRQWVVHASQENLLPSRRMNWLRRVRFRFVPAAARVSEPAYYYYGLGDEVQLSVEIIPVRVR